MDNNFDSVLDMYLFEANTLLEQLDEILLKAEKEQAFDKECVDEIFRIMHTIKGSSAMMQFNSIMTISHKVEDLFFYIRENGIKNNLNEALVTLVFKITDFIKAEISKIESGDDLTENLEQFEKEILDFLQTISGGKTEAEAALTLDKEKIEVETEEKYAIRIFFDDDCGMENLRAFFIINQLEETGIEFECQPENVESIPQTSQIIIRDGFLVTLKDKDHLNAAVNIVKGALNVKNYTVMETNGKESPAGVENEYKKAYEKSEEKIYSVKNSTVNTEENKNVKNTEVKHNKQSLITVNLSKLDSLVDIVGEIVIAESMVASDKEISKLNLESFTKSTRQLRKLTDELQDIVMSLRMVPISGVFQKMKRIVRDMGKELDKDVELTLIGDETEVDKTIVDGISDPIMHLVRNAMDHGMEDRDERIRNGKNPKGSIRLSAMNTGGEIHICVEDDGRGLNTDKILAKAKQKGMLQKAESEYTAKEAYQFLMLPGFSTNETVTEFSGRGVGMDVVKKNVEKVGGTVVLDSRTGKGTAVTFKIPLTLAIVSGMQVVVGDTEFIIPIKNIQQSFKANTNDIIKNTDDSEMIILRDKCYPIVRLHKLYNMETEVTQINDGILILVEAGEGKICLFADKILGEQQVVVKPLPSVFNKYEIKESGISGCSILGDGSINLIMDVARLVENI